MREDRYEPVIVEQETTGKLFFAMTPLNAYHRHFEVLSNAERVFGAVLWRQS